MSSKADSKKEHACVGSSYAGVDKMDRQEVQQRQQQSPSKRAETYTDEANTLRESLVRHRKRIKSSKESGTHLVETAQDWTHTRREMDGRRNEAHSTSASGERTTDGNHASGHDDDEVLEVAGLPQLTTGFVAGPGLRLGDDDGSSDSESSMTLKRRTRGAVGNGDGDDRVWSDADEGQESIDEDAADRRTAGTQRKNRMGQRARRALYEKKYGKEANHHRLRRGEDAKTADAMKNERRRWKEQQKLRGAPQTLRSTDHLARPSFSHGGARPQHHSFAPSTAHAQPDARERRIDRQPLSGSQHPSWTAKQQQRQRQQAALLSPKDGPFPRKIVFDC